MWYHILTYVVNDFTVICGLFSKSVDRGVDPAHGGPGRGVNGENPAGSGFPRKTPLWGRYERKNSG
jgi:hypothetical protein